MSSTSLNHIWSFRLCKIIPPQMLSPNIQYVVLYVVPGWLPQPSASTWYLRGMQGFTYPLCGKVLWYVVRYYGTIYVVLLTWARVKRGTLRGGYFTTSRTVLYIGVVLVYTLKMLSCPPCRPVVWWRWEVPRMTLAPSEWPGSVRSTAVPQHRTHGPVK